MPPKANIVLYKELLRRGHEAGLQSILTELVQVPGSGNEGVAICRATITLEKDGKTRTFQGTGDAAKNNVAPAMQTALIRMAETRAKARALRDAVNIGDVAAEELSDYEDDRSANAQQTQGSRPASGQTRMATGGQPINDTGVQCPSCYSPNLKPHGKGCKAVTAGV